MSIASVRSSRGDSYEILIATRWAIRMLHDVDIVRVDVDSTSLDPSGHLIVVDDVVVSRVDNRTIYCQCKKNQQDFRHWTPAALQEDLRKTARQLVRDPHSVVRFYSATPFGEMGKLCEHARLFQSAAAYNASLEESSGLCDINRSLERYWKSELVGTCVSQYDLLCRLEFHLTVGLPELLQELLGCLRQYVTQAEQVLDRLIGIFSSQKSRSSNGQSEMPTTGVTRDRLLSLLTEIGSSLTPPRAEQDLLAEFRSASMVGRNWRRDIGGRRLARKAIDQVLELVLSGTKRVLVTDGPGYGKTCLLLELADRIEAESSNALLFIQASIFSECETADTRRAMGLRDDVIEAAGRLAEYRPVTVIIDSLDVLSLAREHRVLDYFLSLIDRFSLIPRVTVVAACRNYDRKYDHRLKNRDWGKIVVLGPLEWETQVLPLLNEWAIDPKLLAPVMRDLLVNPRMLAIFDEIVRRGSVPTAGTMQDLTECYLSSVVLNDMALGAPAMAHLERIAMEMLKLRRMSLPAVQAGIPERLMNPLLSAGVIVESGERAITFGHQTILDVLVVRAAFRERKTLLDFICSQPATPFARPAIRGFFFYLRSVDINGFRGQVRAALMDRNVAFQIKRLIAESLAEFDPEDTDWPLIKHIYLNHLELFKGFYFATKRASWFQFLEKFWWPIVVFEKSVFWARTHARHLGLWLPLRPDDVIRSWLSMLDANWISEETLCQDIEICLDKFSEWKSDLTRDLFEKLLPIKVERFDFLGSKICAWIESTGSGDDLLWRFICRDVDSEALYGLNLDTKLRCAPVNLGSNRQFLKSRMTRSESLLTEAIYSVDSWSFEISKKFFGGAAFSDNFLTQTSFGLTHARVDSHHVGSEFTLFNAIEEACLLHAKENTSWWRKHESKLRQSHEAALRYIAIRAYTENPNINLTGVEAILVDADMLTYRWSFEIAQLLNASFLLLELDVQAKIVDLIVNIHAEREIDNKGQNPSVVMLRRDYLQAIPIFCLPPAAVDFLNHAKLRFGPSSDRPRIEREGGLVRPPFSSDELLGLSDDAVLQIVQHYDDVVGGERGFDFLVGGTNEVIQVVRDAACSQPVRFISILEGRWSSLPSHFKDAILGGVATHLRYRFGNLSSGTPWVPSETPTGSELAGGVIRELSRHRLYWRRKRETAEALEACSWVIETEFDVARVASLIEESSDADDPSDDRSGGGGGGLIGIAINSTRGTLADAAMVITTRLVDSGRDVPELLPELLFSFASDSHAAVRAVLTRRLPVLLQSSPELGWRVFSRAMARADAEMWREAEPCLYYSYHASFDKVDPFLEDVLASGAFETWGRISALACLANHVSFEKLTRDIEGIADAGAWRGAAQVFSSNFRRSENFDKCISGLTWEMEHCPKPEVVVAAVLLNGFGADSPPLRFTPDFIQKIFSVRNQCGCEGRESLHGFLEWLEVLSWVDVEGTLMATEIMLSDFKDTQESDVLNLTSGGILNSLFQEAEDREASDGGLFLNRVIAVQDVLLKCGAYELDQWLKDAERP